MTSVSMVLLAGGFGTRIAHLLAGVPKPMVEVAGRPFIEWLIRYYAAHGVGDFVLSTGHLSEVIEGHFQSSTLPGAKVSCRRETAPLGTAGGFLNATKDLADPVDGWLVANGDSLLAANPLLLLEAARKNGWDGALFGLEVTDASRFGTLGVSAKNTLETFSEKRAGAGLINAGVYWLERGSRGDFPPMQPLSFETEVFPELLARGRRIGVVPVSVPFIDIGTPASLDQAAAFVRGIATKLPNT
jgi:D-glycero-alpha-D-manno-heptose 1-phosphate guanylyltransferase